MASSNKLLCSTYYSVLVLFISCLSPTIQALDDGFWTYDLVDGYAEITGRINSCPHDTVIPEEIDGNPVKSVGSYAFRDAQLNSLTLPNTLTHIKTFAFANNSISTLIIPDSVVSIGSYAFYYNQLTDLVIPESVTNLSLGAFVGNQITSLTLSKGLTEIEGEVFSANKLTSVTIPETVTEIGASAFRSNGPWERIVIPKNVTSIGGNAFTYNGGGLEVPSIHFFGERPEMPVDAFGTDSYQYYLKRVIGDINDYDYVIPIPDTSRPYALSIANSLGIPYVEAIIKNRYIYRTFIMDTQEKRKHNLKRKLNGVHKYETMFFTPIKW